MDMKRTIAWLLSLVLLLGTLSGCAADSKSAMDDLGIEGDMIDELPDDEEDAAEEDAPEEDAPEEDAPEEDEEDYLDFEEAVEAQSFAAAMACYLADLRRGSGVSDPLLLWDMAGWYAAWLCTVEDCDLISGDRVEDFLRSVGYQGVPELPESWAEYGVVRVFTAPDKVTYYDFDQHKKEMDAMLGVNTEVSVTAAGPLDAVASVTYHYDSGEALTWDYDLRFAPNGTADSAFAYRLAGVGLPAAGPQWDRRLNFTYEELTAANRLRSSLSIYPAVHWYDPDHSPDMVYWIFPRGDALAYIYKWDDYSSGEYHGCRFEYEHFTDGQRAMIGAFDEADGSWDKLDGILTESFSSLLSVRLDRVEADLCWLECVAWGGMREVLAVDKGTLVLRQREVYYAEELPPSVTVYEYTQSPPRLPYLDGWDGEMRTVTLCWENFSGPVRNTWTETVEIPADWEYLPYDGRWGDYTVWMDPGYTKPYVYPGPGVDYTLYLSTAKG